MRRDGNRIDAKQANAIRAFDTNRFCDGHFRFGERQTLAQHALLLVGRPLGGQRKQLLQLGNCRLSIHDCFESKNPAAGAKNGEPPNKFPRPAIYGP